MTDIEKLREEAFAALREQEGRSSRVWSQSERETFIDHYIHAKASDNELKRLSVKKFSISTEVQIILTYLNTIFTTHGAQLLNIFPLVLHVIILLFFIVINFFLLLIKFLKFLFRHPVLLVIIISLALFWNYSLIEIIERVAAFIKEILPSSTPAVEDAIQNL